MIVLFSSKELTKILRSNENIALDGAIFNKFLINFDHWHQPSSQQTDSPCFHSRSSNIPWKD